MLAEKASSPFSSNDYIYEPKWDGYRALFYTKDHRLLSRNGKSLLAQFPHFAKIDLKEAVLDGELVALQEGRPNFTFLRHNPHKAVFMAFDLLSFAGQDYCALPLETRRNNLQELIQGQNVIGFSPDYQDGIKLFNALSKANWEGEIATRKGSPYKPGKRSSDWLKIVAYKEVDAVVMDWSPVKNTLLLGLYKDDLLLPIGHVPSSEFAKVANPLNKVVTVRFREFTGQALRHPSHVRLRTDKLPKECMYDQLL